MPYANLTLPTDFGWTGPGLAFGYRGGRIVWYNEAEVLATYTPSNPLDYYIAPEGTGSDSNDGLTRATPKLSLGSVITAAASASRVPRVNFSPGVYYNNRIFAGTNRTASLWLRRDPMYSQGEVVFAPNNALTWTSAGGNVWKATVASFGSCYDLAAPRTYRDRFGKWIPNPVVQQADVADDAAAVALLKPGQCAMTAADTTIYVYRWDGSQPDINVLAGANTGTGIRVGVANGNLYWFENICVVAGDRAFLADNNASDQQSTIVIKDCWAVGSQTASAADLFRINGHNSIMVRVFGGWAEKDGINYTPKNSNTGWSIELDCEMRQNGFGSTLACNATTGHDGHKAVRFNVIGGESRGPTFADTGTNTGAVNYCCTGLGSKDTGVAIAWSDFVALSAAKVWCFNCRGYTAGTGSVTAYGMAANGNAILYENGGVFASPSGTESGGTVVRSFF